MPHVWNISYARTLPSPAVVAVVLGAAASLEGLCDGITRRQVHLETGAAGEPAARIRLTFEANGATFLVNRALGGEPTEARFRELVRLAFEAGRRMLGEYVDRRQPRRAA
jgi:hypothetical protein